MSYQPRIPTRVLHHETCMLATDSRGSTACITAMQYESNFAETTTHIEHDEATHVATFMQCFNNSHAI